MFPILHGSVTVSSPLCVCLCRKEAVNLSEVTNFENEGITATEEDTGDYEVMEFDECDAYGIVPAESESERISTKECSAYGIVPETDADNNYM